MASVSLTTLRARVRELCDMTGSSFVTDGATSVDAFLNAGLDEVYELIADHIGPELFLTSFPTTLSAGTATISATGILRLVSVELSYQGKLYELRRTNFNERLRYQSDTFGPGARYSVTGDTIHLYPTPNATYTVTVWHVPVRSTLQDGADTINLYNGWEEYAVVYAAIRCLQKEESDVSALLAMKAEIRARIEAASATRDADEPATVRDVSTYRHVRTANDPPVEG